MEASTTSSVALAPEGYELIKSLGKGAQGEVFLARHRSGILVAIKFIERGYAAGPTAHARKQKAEYIENEILTLRKLRHPYIVSMKEVILTRTHLGIVMEYVKGGTLQNVVEGQKLSEDNARCFFHKLIVAVAYCHTKRVANRDIKPENILLSPEPNGIMGVKLCDFGLCKDTERGAHAKSLVGTLWFAAPEVLKQLEYDALKADVWSCGVTLYFTLTGYQPWLAPGEEEALKSEKKKNMVTQEMLKRLSLGQYERSKLQGLSPECQVFIAKLLTVNPADRPAVQQIVDDAWFKRCLPEGYRQFVLDDPLIMEQVVEPCQQSEQDIRAILEQARGLEGNPTSTFETGYSGPPPSSHYPSAATNGNQFHSAASSNHTQNITIGNGMANLRLVSSSRAHSGQPPPQQTGLTDGSLRMLQLSARLSSQNAALQMALTQGYTGESGQVRQAMIELRNTMNEILNLGSRI